MDSNICLPWAAIVTNSVHLVTIGPHYQLVWRGYSRNDVVKNSVYFVNVVHENCSQINKSISLSVYSANTNATITPEIIIMWRANSKGKSQKTKQIELLQTFQKIKREFRHFYGYIFSDNIKKISFVHSVTYAYQIIYDKSSYWFYLIFLEWGRVVVRYTLTKPLGYSTVVFCFYRNR